MVNGFRLAGLRFIVVLLLAALTVGGCGVAPKASEQPAAPAPGPAPGAQQEAQVSKKPETLAELAAYAGADREQILIEGAKKEGALTVYTSMPQEDMAAVTDAFTEKYGIQVTVWRAKSESVLERVVAEQNAKRYDVDVVETNGPELEILYREKLVQPINSPFHSSLVNGALAPHKGWAATRLNLFVQAYNTKLVPKEELPKTWEDLADPRWKDRLTVESEDWDWFSGVVGFIGEEKGLKLFEDIVAANGIGIRVGHSLAVELIAAGEVPMLLTAYSYHVDQMKAKGGPVDWIAIEPAIARPNGATVLKNSTRPYSALLFYDFLLSAGQEVMFKRDMVVTNTTIDATAKNTPMKLVDPTLLLDNSQKWIDLWDTMILKKK